MELAPSLKGGWGGFKAVLAGPCWVCRLSAVTGEDERVSMFSLVELAARPPRLFSTNKRLRSHSENKERTGAAEVEGCLYALP